MTTDQNTLLMASLCCLALVTIVILISSSMLKKNVEKFSLFGNSGQTEEEKEADAERDKKITELRSKVKTNTATIESLQNAIKTLESTVKGLSSLSSLEDKIKQLMDGHKGITDKITDIQSKLSLIESKNYSEQIDKLLEADKVLQQAINDLTANGANSQTNLNKTITELDNKIEDIKKSMSKLVTTDEKGNIKCQGDIEAVALGSKEAIITNNLRVDGSITSNKLDVLETLNANKVSNYTMTLIFDKVYPVGSIYMSFDDVDPSKLFGGTWERISDKFLYPSTSSGKTGGEASHILTVNEMPQHSHRLYSGYGDYADTKVDTIRFQQWANNARGYNASGLGGKQFIENTGGNEAHNNMPPYITVYCWRRLSLEHESHS